MSDEEEVTVLLTKRKVRKVLVAFDKFKGCMDAHRACEVACDALFNRFMDVQVTASPLTDGGEGFCKILTEGVGGELVEVRVLDARHREKAAHFGMVPVENLPKGCIEMLNLPEGAEKLAVVEMAQGSGLAGLPDDLRDPWEASTIGTGLLLREAANIGADAILLGIGGSATNDLGLGALEALGTEFFDEEGQPLVRIAPKDFQQIAEIDLFSNQLPLPPLRIACDVQNPLLGPEGATPVFSPQKGLPEEGIQEMEEALCAAAHALLGVTGKPDALLEMSGAGAAGGTGLGLMLAYDAVFLPGFQLFSQWFALDEIIPSCDLILTGEGNFDESSLHGKAPWSLTEAAGKAGVPVQLYCGRVSESVRDGLPRHVSAHSISPDGLGIDAALKQGENLLKVSLFVNLSRSPKPA